MRLTIKGG